MRAGVTCQSIPKPKSKHWDKIGQPELTSGLKLASHDQLGIKRAIPNSTLGY